MIKGRKTAQYNDYTTTPRNDKTRKMLRKTPLRRLSQCKKNQVLKNLKLV